MFRLGLPHVGIVRTGKIETRGIPSISDWEPFATVAEARCVCRSSSLGTWFSLSAFTHALQDFLVFCFCGCDLLAGSNKGEYRSEVLKEGGEAEVDELGTAGASL